MLLQLAQSMKLLAALITKAANKPRQLLYLELSNGVTQHKVILTKPVQVKTMERAITQKPVIYLLKLLMNMGKLLMLTIKLAQAAVPVR